MTPKASGDWWKQGSFSGSWTFATGCRHSALPPERRRAGCANCWACKFVQNGRFARVHSGETGVVQPYHKIIEHPERLEKPLKRRKPSVFTNIYVEWTDLREEYLAEVLHVIERCQQHVFVLLTKEPKLAVKMFHYLQEEYCTWKSPEGETGIDMPENLILLASAWDQASTDEACAAFAELPVLWGLHMEPCLAPVDLRAENIGWCMRHGTVSTDVQPACDCVWEVREQSPLEPRKGSKPCWIVVGSENGPGARPFDLQWARYIQAQCKAVGIPYWFKGAWKQDVPEDMIVREVPW